MRFNRYIAHFYNNIARCGVRCSKIDVIGAERGARGGSVEKRARITASRSPVGAAASARG